MNYSDYLFSFIVCQTLDREFLDVAGKYNLKDGSTLLMSLVQNGKLSISNVGDSCGFVMKTNGQMSKVTVD